MYHAIALVNPARSPRVRRRHAALTRIAGFNAHAVKISVGVSVPVIHHGGRQLISNGDEGYFHLHALFMHRRWIKLSPGIAASGAHSV